MTSDDGMTVTETLSQAVARQAAEIERLRARLPTIPSKEEDCTTLEQWRQRAMYLESAWSECSYAFNKTVGKKNAEIERLRLSHLETEKEIKQLRSQLAATERGYKSFRDTAETEYARLRALLREGLSEHVRLHVHPYFPAWEKRVREALGE